MKPIDIEYQITIHDYRKATYYALFLRHRRALQIMFAVILFSIVYAFAAYLGLGQPNPLVFLLAGAYLIWGLFLFAGAEKSVLTYLRSKDNFLGCTYHALFEKSRIRIRVPERNVDFSCSVHNLAFVFELSALYLLYTSAQEVFLVPKASLSEEDSAALRRNFRTILKDRFSTRFEKHV